MNDTEVKIRIPNSKLGNERREPAKNVKHTSYWLLNTNVGISYPKNPISTPCSNNQEKWGGGEVMSQDCGV